MKVVSLRVKARLYNAGETWLRLLAEDMGRLERNEANMTCLMGNVSVYIQRRVSDFERKTRYTKYQM